MCKEIKCPRCGGIGYINSYKHVEDGICFLCEGKGTVTQIEYEKFITSQENSDKCRTRRLEKLEAYRKATAEKVDKQREEWERKKNQKQFKHEEPKEPKPYNDETDKALDDLMKFWEE